MQLLYLVSLIGLRIVTLRSPFEFIQSYLKEDYFILELQAQSDKSLLMNLP